MQINFGSFLAPSPLPSPEGEGTGGYLISFYTGRLHGVLTHWPFIYHFWRKRYPFLFLLLTNGPPFKYLVQSAASLLTALLVLYPPNIRFPYPYMYLRSWNPYPFIYLKPEKGAPFGQSLCVQAIIGSTPRIPSQVCSRYTVTQKRKKETALSLAIPISDTSNLNTKFFLHRKPCR